LSGGRPAGLSLDDDESSPVAQESGVIDSRGRIRIPAWIASDLSWLPAKSGPETHALAVFKDPGVIKLLNWDHHSSSVLSRRQYLVEEGDLLALRDLEDCYRKILIPEERRPTLGEGALTHLGLPIGKSSAIYIFRIKDVIELESPTSRDRRLLESSSTFHGLPQ
jgi:hypothetical protein